MDQKTVTTNFELHPPTVRYLAKWIRQLYIPASSIGDNLHIAQAIASMLKEEDRHEN